MRKFRIVVMLATVLVIASGPSAQRANANAADLQTLTALTLSIKGSVTVNYAFTAYGYGLTDYSGPRLGRPRGNRRGVCLFGKGRI
jgi:hypothetical protein